MIDKSILNQYIDLKQEIKDVQSRIEKVENEIERLEQEKVADKVSGGMGNKEHFRIEGYAYPEISKKKALLYSRLSTLSQLEVELSETLNSIEIFISGLKDSHIRRIITYRFIENLTWSKVAEKMGGGNTDESVKKAFQRFMDKN